MMNLDDVVDLPVYLTYDDVLLLPNYSKVIPYRIELSFDYLSLDMW